jgi:hypothetical protein
MPYSPAVWGPGALKRIEEQWIPPTGKMTPGYAPDTPAPTQKKKTVKKPATKSKRPRNIGRS